VVKTLDTEPGLPLGLCELSTNTLRVETQSLEPGDRLLFYSDGVIEARDAHGEFFGVDRLADLVAREAAAGQPAPETMRRLMHAILNHQDGSLQDDATTMLVEWEAGGQQRIALTTPTKPPAVIALIQADAFASPHPGRHGTGEPVNV
jgi:serine/threonine protein phosphatase PrpC